MLTENIKIKDDLDCKTLENLYNKQFCISKEDKPIEKIIDASDRNCKHSSPPELVLFV